MFLSYSREDEALLKEFLSHLAALERQGFITIWSDRQITPGAEWESNIDHHLEKADIIVLFVSSHFIASDYCYELETPRALERHDNGECRVLPVIAEPVDWSGALFAKLQILPKGAKPVSQWESQHAGWRDVVAGIRSALDSFRQE